MTTVNRLPGEAFTMSRSFSSFALVPLTTKAPQIV